jgi:hypothetical protein
VTDPFWDTASRTTQERATVKITPTTLLAAAATVATAGLIAAPLSSAEDVTTTTVGSEAKLIDGNVIQGWTISDLRPSSDVIPYPVAGTLWEATATDEALQGSATPIVSNLNARARSGETYRVLFGVATPQGVNPATLAQGQKTTGKVYFDVTGDAPDAVVYSAGGQDLLAWAQAAPAPLPPHPLPLRLPLHPRLHRPHPCPLLPALRCPRPRKPHRERRFRREAKAHHFPPSARAHHYPRVLRELRCPLVVRARQSWPPLNQHRYPRAVRPRCCRRRAKGHLQCPLRR